LLIRSASAPATSGAAIDVPLSEGATIRTLPPTFEKALFLSAWSLAPTPMTPWIAAIEYGSTSLPWLPAAATMSAPICIAVSIAVRTMPKLWRSRRPPPIERLMTFAPLRAA